MFCIYSDVKKALYLLEYSCGESGRIILDEYAIIGLSQKAA